MHLILLMQRKGVEILHMMEYNHHDLRYINCGFTL